MKYALSYRYDDDFSQCAAKLLKSDLQKELQAQQCADRPLRSYRKRLYLTREELGAMLGMTPARVAQLETDISAMTVGELQRCMTLFGVSADTLLFGSAERG